MSNENIFESAEVVVWWCYSLASLQGLLVLATLAAAATTTTTARRAASKRRLCSLRLLLRLERLPTPRSHHRLLLRQLLV